MTDATNTSPVTTMPPPPTTSTPGTTTDDTATSSTTMTSAVDSTSTTDDPTGSGSESGSESGSGSSSESGSGSSSESGDPLPECVDQNAGNMVPLMLMGDNTGAGDDLAASCAGGGGGEEFVYTFTAPADGTYRFDTFDSAADTALTLYDSCMGDEVACDDTNVLEDVSGSYLEADMTAGQVVLVGVDGTGGDVGAFALNIAQTRDAAEICAFGNELELCELPGMGMTPGAGTLYCDEPGVNFFFDFYEIPVTAGDCVAVAVDNIDPVAGATGDVSGDLAAVVQDPTGAAAIFDDEQECTDPAFDGFACPSGSAIMAADGTVVIWVTQYGGGGCPNESPYSLAVAINGEDVDLSAATPAFDDISMLRDLCI